MFIEKRSERIPEVRVSQGGEQSVVSWDSVQARWQDILNRRATANRHTVPLFVIRHGETVANAAHIQAGWTDTPLTPHGCTQAQRTGQALAGNPFSEAASSSDLRRAEDTAGIMIGVIMEPGAIIITDPRLREQNWGELEGLPKSLVDEKRKDLADSQRAAPSAETLEEVRKRFTHALVDIAATHIMRDTSKRMCTLVTTSRGPIRAVLKEELTKNKHELGLEEHALLKNFPNGGGLIILSDGKEVELVAIINPGEQP